MSLRFERKGSLRLPSRFGIKKSTPLVGPPTPAEETTDYYKTWSFRQSQFACDYLNLMDPPRRLPTVPTTRPKLDIPSIECFTRGSTGSSSRNSTVSDCSTIETASSTSSSGDEDISSIGNIYSDLYSIGLDFGILPPETETIKRKTNNKEMDSRPVDPFRFSQATLEDTQEDELNAILGELSALQLSLDREMKQQTVGCGNGLVIDSNSKIQVGEKSSDSGARTDSPDNDSGFSDNASLLSSRSSLSASGSSSGSSTASSANCSRILNNNNHKSISGSENNHTIHGQQTNNHSLISSSSVLHANELAAILCAKIDSDPISFPDEKAEKIRIALAKMRAASVTRLYVKAFSPDGSSKALMVEESMSCGRVLQLLADKNHVPLSSKWTLVEHLPHLHMERIYEDHENMVENLLMWTRDSKNKIYFVERDDKYDLFTNPQKYFIPGVNNHSQHPQPQLNLDEHGKHGLIEEFFNHGLGVPEVESSLYLKAEGKKAWKKFTFVLRASGIYYYPKGRSVRDLVCLVPIDHNQQIYEGIGGWRKKFKSPTEFGFVLKPSRLQAKSHRHIKYLCAEDQETLRLWIVGLRIAKNGKTLWDNYRSLQEDIANEDLDRFGRSVSLASMPIVQIQTSHNSSRKPSISSIQSSDIHLMNTINEIPSPTPISTPVPLTITREEIGFESDSPVGGTIKRKPSTVLTPKIPLTLNTRSLVSEYITPGEGNVVTLSHTLQRKKSNGSIASNTGNGTLTKKSSLTTIIPVPLPEEEFEDLPPPPPELLMDSGDENSSDPASSVPPPNPKPKKAVTFATSSPIPSPALSSQPQSPSQSQLPKRLEDPPTHFLSDLQRVMQKKWQVAQKCQIEPTTSPQEILGFRVVPGPAESPTSDECTSEIGDGATVLNPATLNNVRAWVSQHYGGPEEETVQIPPLPPVLNSQSIKPIPPNKPRVSFCLPPPSPAIAHVNHIPYPSPTIHYHSPTVPNSPPIYAHPQNVVIYENFEGRRAAPQDQSNKISEVQLRAKKPPPPIPKRADSTHLSVHFVYN